MSDDPFQKLPDWAKEKLSISNMRKEWKKCAACQADSKERPLKACSGCAQRPQPIFYCSKECQKSHWRVHKIDCRLKSAELPETRFPKSRGDAPDLFLERILKRIERWHAVYQNLLRWCITQIYHFNPYADPEECFINIEVNPDSFQIICISIEPKKCDPTFNTSRPLLSHPYFYQINVCVNTPNQCGCIFFGSNKDLYSLESRAKFKGCKQWAYIATHIISRSHSSRDIVFRELAILYAAIDHQIERRGVSFDEFEYIPQTAFGIAFVSSHMLLWYGKLSKLDLWTPLDAGGQLHDLLTYP